MSNEFVIEYKENKKLRNIVFLTGIVILIIMTLVFAFTNLDIWLISLFYDFDTHSFFMANNEPWLFLYKNEEYFLIPLVIIGIVFTLIGHFTKDPKQKMIGRYGGYILLVIIITAGMVINYIFKEYWGRPRPRETIPFGLNFSFFPIWYPAFIDILPSAMDPRDLLDNSSFPAGHPVTAICSIALFFALNHPEVFVLLFKQPTKRKMNFIKTLKYMALAFSIIVGSLMAIGRAIQGGHWFSDSMWAFAFIYLIAIVLYYYIFNIPKWEKDLCEKIKGRSQDWNQNYPVFANLIIFLYIVGLFTSTIWFIEYSIRPDVFLPELIFGIVIFVTAPYIFHRYFRKLEGYKTNTPSQSLK